MFQQAEFLISAATLSQLPEDLGQEIAFIGRSNAGKSTAINTITGIKGLARTSKTPGRTQLMNCFTLTPTQRLIDLPGYGYAKVAKKMQAQWLKEVNAYLLQRQSLRALVVVMDCRHPFKPSDQEVLQWAQQSQLPVLALLTKADKLNQSARAKTVKQAAVFAHESMVVQLFSGQSQLGLEPTRQQLWQWLQPG